MLRTTQLALNLVTDEPQDGSRSTAIQGTYSDAPRLLRCDCEVLVNFLRAIVFMSIAQQNLSAQLHCHEDLQHHDMIQELSLIHI